MFRSQNDYEKMMALLEKKASADELQKLVKLTVAFDNAKTTPEIKRLQKDVDKLNQQLSTAEYKALRDQVEKVVLEYERKFDQLFKKALKMRAEGKGAKKSSKSLSEKKTKKLLEEKFVLSGATHSTLSAQDASFLQPTKELIDLQKRITALQWLQAWSKDSAIIVHDKLCVAALDESKELLTQLNANLSTNGKSLSKETNDSLLARINSQLIEIEKLLEEEIDTGKLLSFANMPAIIENFNRKETRQALQAIVPEFESYWANLMEKKELTGLKATSLRAEKEKPTSVSEKASSDDEHSDAAAISQLGLLGGGANAKPSTPVQPAQNETQVTFKK